MPTLKHAPEISAEEQVVKDHILEAIARPESLGNPGLIRRFASERPELFSGAALSILENAMEETPALQDLTSLLLVQPNLCSFLIDPGRFTPGAAVAIVKRLIARDPALPVRIARSIVANGADTGDSVTPQRIMRALEIVETIGATDRITPILQELAKHPDTRVHSKASLLIGKRMQSPAWVRMQMGRAKHSRLRADAIESIWGLEDPDSRQLLWDYTGDENNRVAGNAWFGLHLIGDPQVTPELLKLAADSRPEFRSTAAWMMARISVALFREPLNALLKDDDPSVKRAALRAMVRFSRKKSSSKTSPESAQTPPSESDSDWLTRPPPV